MKTIKYLLLVVAISCVLFGMAGCSGCNDSGDKVPGDGVNDGPQK